MRRKRGGDNKIPRTRQIPRDEQNQFVVYAIKQHDPRARPSPQGFPSMDEAAGACITLSEQGYKILGVKLPGGNYVVGSQIEWAIRLGVSNVKIALGAI